MAINSAAGAGTRSPSSNGEEEQEDPKLPPALIVDALSTLRWPLDRSSAARPMELLPLNQLPCPVLPTCGEIHVREIIALLLSASGSSGGGRSFGERRQEEDGEEGEITPPHSKQQQWAWIATALLLLGHGYVDHAHNLVGPLSFHKSLPYFHGLTIATEPDVLAAASFVHSLVHRREGPHPSEFGQTGFCNAQFWAGATLRSGGEETLPLYAIHSRIAQLASANGPEAQDWFHSNYGPGLLEEWDPRPVTDLCEEVLPTRGAGGGGGAAGHLHHHRHSLLEFAEQAALTELQELLLDALMNLGFSLPNSDTVGLTTHLSSQQEDNLLSSSMAPATTTTTSPPFLLPTTLEEAGSTTGPFCDQPIVVTTSASPHRIVLANEAWTNLCGYTSQQAVGKTLSSLVNGPESNFAVASAVARQCCDTQSPQEVHLVNYTSAGDRFVNHLIMAPLYDDDDREDRHQLISPTTAATTKVIIDDGGDGGNDNNAMTSNATGEHGLSFTLSPATMRPSSSRPPGSSSNRRPAYMIAIFGTAPPGAGGRASPRPHIY